MIILSRASAKKKKKKKKKKGGGALGFEIPHHYWSFSSDIMAVKVLIYALSTFVRVFFQSFWRHSEKFSI